MFPENPLQLYGAALETYRGTGQLTLSSERKINCEFIAGQFDNGKTVILCTTPDLVPSLMVGLAVPTRFEGETHEGYHVEIDHVVSETNYLPETFLPGTHLALRVGHLRVYRRTRYSRRHLSVTITNLSGIHSDVAFSYDTLRYTLRPLENAAANLERLEVLRGTLPTAQLQVNTRASLERVTEAVNEVCYLLSIALGTKVQWIALTEETRAGSWLCRHHYSHITKRYGTLYTIDPQGSDISTLLQLSSDGRFKRAREQAGLSNAVIDTYLDAKSEADFLQVRAIKLVVAVEMLKAEYADKSGAHSLIFPPKDFGVLVPKMKKTVKDVFVNSTADQRAEVYANMSNLNRTPFSSQLRQLCAAVRMPVQEEEINRFVASRNKIVHEGRFYCERATDKERAKLAPLPTLQSEWFWLLHFVDRLFLRAIGYEGTYIDWSNPSSPTRRQLSPNAVHFG